MDSWVLLLDSVSIKRIVDRLANQLYDDYVNVPNARDLLIVCILKGASIFTTHILERLTELCLGDYVEKRRGPIPSTPALYFIEVSSYLNEQSQAKEIEILSLIHPEKFQNKQVILLDELCDNGKTMEVVCQHIIKQAAIREEDVVTCVAFSKQKVRKYRDPDYVGVTVPDVWLVGYGLDDKQQLRGLKELWAKPKPKAVNGGNEVDTVHGGNEVDTVHGGNEVDTVHGGNEVDTDDEIFTNPPLLEVWRNRMSGELSRN